MHTSSYKVLRACMVGETAFVELLELAGTRSGNNNNECHVNGLSSTCLGGLPMHSYHRASLELGTSTKQPAARYCYMYSIYNIQAFAAKRPASLLRPSSKGGRNSGTLRSASRSSKSTPGKEYWQFTSSLSCLLQ